jgi:nitrogen fixation/metabolism regulation signal transduction histidine kinase
MVSVFVWVLFCRGISLTWNRKRCLIAVVVVVVVVVFCLLRLVIPRELMKQRWNKKDAKRLCPNLVKLINKFNEVGIAQ